LRLKTESYCGAGNMMALPVTRVRLTYAVVVSAFFTLIGPGWIEGATTERVVTNNHTGLAISGFDPVAYFTTSRAVLGRADVETRFVGATWRFVNAGNREAFIDNPSVYMPTFGGYDPTGVARGVAVAGHPEVWLISGERLYLFRDRETRDAFIASAEELTAVANRQWPDVQRMLAR
jgi:hypothetical protein